MLFSKKKKGYVYRNGEIVGFDPDNVPVDLKEFDERVKRVYPKFDNLDRLFKIPVNEQDSFIRELEDWVHEKAQKERYREMEQREDEQRKRRIQENEIIRRREQSEELAVAKAAEAKTRKAEEQLELEQLEPPQPVKESVAIETEEHVKEQNTAGLALTPDERKERSETNLDKVLDWLRSEPYSTVENIALMMGMSKPGARKMLNKFVKDGWLVRDEVEKWPGVAGKIHLYGVSQHGLNAQFAIDDDAPSYNRVFRRGKTKTSGGTHILLQQHARIYLDRIGNPNGLRRPYTLDRDLPNFGAKDKAFCWRKYPDGVIKNSHLEHPDKPGRKLSIGIELERSGKGQQRYREILKAHLSNINRPSTQHDLSDRYDVAYYFLSTRRKADNMRVAFDTYIDDRTIDVDESAKKLFIFDTYFDLVKRIKALDDR